MKELLTLRRDRAAEEILNLEGAGEASARAPLKYRAGMVTVGIVITPAKLYVEHGGVPALRGVNVAPGVITTDELATISEEGHAANQKSALRTGDVVVVRTGQAGAAAVVPNEFDGWNCIDLIVVRPGDDLSPRYVQYVLNSTYARRRVAEHSVGSIQAHFNISAMKQVPFPVLPRHEQEQAVKALDERLEPIDRLSGTLTRQESALTERRQALITAAVTGEFDVSTARGRGTGV
jgi:type I restriction enzyme S subunit